MGWLNSVTIFQHVHRQILMSSDRLSAQLFVLHEWYREHGIPSFEFLRALWQVYVDDVDICEIVDKETAESLFGTTCDWQTSLTKMYESSGIPFSPRETE